MLESHVNYERKGLPISNSEAAEIQVGSAEFKGNIKAITEGGIVKDKEGNLIETTENKVGDPIGLLSFFNGLPESVQEKVKVLIPQQKD